MKKPKKKYLLLYGIIGVLLLAAILPIRKAVNQYTDGVVRANLSTILDKSAKEKYILDYDKLSFNIFTQRISLTNFRIYPSDSSKFYSTHPETIPSFFGITVNSLEIHLQEEWEIFLDKKLIIEELKIEGPKVKIHQHRTDTQKIKFAKISGDIYQVVTKYLSLLNLKSFNVKNAEIDFTTHSNGKTQQYRFEPISFKLKNFRMKEGGYDKDKIFFTDDFELNSGRQKFVLPDSSHEISFDRFKISTLKNQIQFFNLRVVSLLSDSIERNQITLFVPAIRLNSVDFERAYIRNEYSVKTIKIERPAIKFLINKPQQPKTEEQLDELEKWLNLIQVDATHITNGNIAVNDSRSGNRKTYLVNGISLKINGARIDTSILDRINLRELQNNYRLSVRELKHQIPEEELLIKVNDIAYSSITQDFKCNEITIKPNEYKQQKSLRNPTQKFHLENLLVDGISIRKLDLNAISEGKNTTLEEIIIKQPELSLSYDTLFVKLEDSLSQAQNLPHALDSISTKMLKILDAKINVTNSRNQTIKYGSFENANYTGVNLDWNNLNSKNLDIVSLLAKSSIESGKSSWIDPKTKNKTSWGRLIIKPRTKTLFASSFSFIPSKSNETKIGLNQLKIDGFDYNDLFLNKALTGNVLTIQGLDLTLFENDKKANKVNLTQFDFNKIDIAELNVKRYDGDSVNLLLSRLTINADEPKMETQSDSTRVFSYKNIKLSMDKSLVLAKSKKQIVTTQNINFNSDDSTLELSNIRVDPVVSAIQKKDPIFQQRIAKIFVTGFSPNSENVGSFFGAQHIEVCSPITRYSFYESNKKQSNKKDLVQIQNWLLDSLGLNFIKYQTLNVDNGNLDLVWKKHPDSTKEERLIAEQYSINSVGLNINREVKNNDENLYFAKDHVLQLYNVKRVFADTLNNISANEISYSTAQNNLKLKGLSGSFMVKEKNQNKLFVEGTMDLAEFDGIKPIELRNKKQVDLKGIYVVNPKLEFTQLHKNEKQVSRELSLEEKVNDDSTAITKILLQSLKVQNGFIKWDFVDSGAKPLHINHLQLHAEGMQYPNPDSSLKVPQLTDLAFSFGDFEYDVMKNFYTFKLDSIDYNSKNENLRMESVELNPKYGIFEFGQQAGWQKSRLEMFIGAVNLKGFNGKKLLYENKLSMTLLDIDSLWVRNFKDKRLPENIRYIPLPQERLDSLKMGVDIKRLVLKKGEVTHIQIAKNGIVPGKIYFSDVSARASNIRNNFGDQKESKVMRLNAMGKLMGDGLISATFEFNNEEPHGYFKGHASLGEFDARTLNNYLTHTAFVGVKSGKVLNAGVDFKAYNDFGTGGMKLLYNDLHVTFLNEEDTTHKGLGVALKGFIANRVVYTKNPHFFITKKGLVYTERDTTKEIFHYWSKLAMSGVASSTGVKNNKKELKKVRKEALRREQAILRDEDEFLEKEKEVKQPYEGK